MSSLLVKRLLGFFLILTVLTVLYVLRYERPDETAFLHNERRSPIISVATVVCGQRVDEALTMIKSVLIFNIPKYPLKIILVAEESLKRRLHETLSVWRQTCRDCFTFQVHSLSFPVEKAETWKTLFKPCAAQRLFLPTLLHDEDSILYLDTDTLLLSPVSEVWEHFTKFNSSQLAALTPEHEDKNVGWYNRFARHPFYGPMGVNSGVMLMNLTRMRSFKWEEQILPLYTEYRLKITWGDQDLINILFFYHPDKLYIMPCQYNYRPDHCMYLSVCNASDGIRILHGNRGYFHSNKQPIFNIIFKAIESYKLEDNSYENLILPLEKEILINDSILTSNCGKVSKQFLIRAKSTLVQSSKYN